MLRTRFTLRFAVAALLAGAAAVSGCSASDTADFAQGTAGAPTPSDEFETDGPKQNITGNDAAAPSTAKNVGNPLCNVEPGTCNPDDDTTRVSQAVQCTHDESATDDAGGGTSSSGASGSGGSDGPHEGCRVTATSAACQPAALQGGSDGASCETGADCAPGYDCIAGEKTNTCRHYCCAGICKTQLTQSGGRTFCDVQKLVDVDRKVPVCMPLKACKLLAHGECSANETCAIVGDTGETGCVAVGNQQAGQSCETEHCAADLTCLGGYGARKCKTLCKMGSATCGSTMGCKTSSIFKDATIGICQDL